jgi:hypothetical protein
VIQADDIHDGICSGEATGGRGSVEPYRVDDDVGGAVGERSEAVAASEERGQEGRHRLRSAVGAIEREARQGA